MKAEFWFTLTSRWYFRKSKKVEFFDIYFSAIKINTGKYFFQINGIKNI